MPTLIDLPLLPLSYLLGCASTAYYLVQWRTGQDVRTLGSGNAGATNAGRVLGVWGFAIALFGDTLKGSVAVAVTAWLAHSPWIVALAVPLVVAGHIWPVQLRLRGGEGFAVALGALLVYDPLLIAILGGLAALLYLLARRRAIAGLVSLLGAPLLALALNRSTPELVALLLVVAMMLWAFRRHVRSLFAKRGA